MFESKKPIVVLVMVLCFLPLSSVQAVFGQCECVLDPHATSIPRGEILGLWVTVTNNTNETQLVGFGTKVTLPSGSKYPGPGFLDGPVAVHLPAHESKSGHISHTIPASAPLGHYIYHGYVGRPDDGLIHECQFEFDVTASGGNGCTACH